MKPTFGSPFEVQKSVSCGVSILHLEKKGLKPQKLPLHSKPGARKTPKTEDFCDSRMLFKG